MQWAKNKQGFTIVELLIVVVVIAILAAITIVSYNGITAQARDSVVKSDIRGAIQSVELAVVQSGVDRYPSYSNYPSFSVSKSMYLTGRNNWYYCLSQDGQSFAFGVIPKGSKGGYIATSSGEISHHPAAFGGKDVCGKIGWPVGPEDPDPGFGSGYLWNFTTSTGTWNPAIK